MAVAISNSLHAAFLFCPVLAPIVTNQLEITAIGQFLLVGLGGRAGWSKTGCNDLKYLFSMFDWNEWDGMNRIKNRQAKNRFGYLGQSEDICLRIRFKKISLVTHEPTD